MATKKFVCRCGNCQTEIYRGESFCSECGEPVYKVCTSCGKDVWPGEKFCPHCGAEVVSRSKAKKPAYGFPGFWYPGFGFPLYEEEEETEPKAATRTRPAPFVDRPAPFGAWSLFFGIISFLLPIFITSILAIVLGAQGVKNRYQLKRSKAGIVLGIITLVITIVMAVLIAIFYTKFLAFLGLGA